MEGAATKPQFPETAAVELRTIDVADAIEPRQMTPPTFSVHAMHDMLPGGISAAMVPVLGVWDQSDFSRGVITIRNAYHGAVSNASPKYLHDWGGLQGTPVDRSGLEEPI